MAREEDKVELFDSHPWGLTEAFRDTGKKNRLLKRDAFHFDFVTKYGEFQRNGGVFGRSYNLRRGPGRKLSQSRMWLGKSKPEAVHGACMLAASGDECIHGWRKIAVLDKNLFPALHVIIFGGESGSTFSLGIFLTIFHLYQITSTTAIRIVG